MSRAVVFCGPSIGRDEAASLCHADIWPPAAAGDVLRAVKSGFTVIGLIDGYFERVAAVWHKELLFALSEGVHVVGGASMGALRAAELYPFGMVGVGRIFDDYRREVIVGDDEVAVSHGSAEDGFATFSMALVDLRDVLQRAQAARHVRPATADALLAGARAVYYPDRTLPAVLAAGRRAGVDEDELRALVAFAANAGPSLKTRDARATLQTVNHIAMASPAQPAIEWEFQRTVFFELLCNDEHTTAETR